jgi:hypothetical protein
MIWWAVITGTIFFSGVGLALIYFVASSKKNLESQMPLGIRSLIATSLTSWCLIVGGMGGVIPFNSIYITAIIFFGAHPVDESGWVMAGCLVFQVSLHFIAFYFFTVNKENQVRRAHYIALAKI